MSENRRCPKCGAELAPNAAHGLCPKCLLDAGFDSQTPSAAGAPTGPFVTPSQAAAATVPKEPRFASPHLESLARQFPQLDSFEHLGQGGMGVVYKARQRNLNRPVAVKILPPSVGEDPAFAERFTREAQALARLNHPNIVQVHDFGRTEDYFYFVMEYVDGVNLRALIRDGKLQPEEALKVVPQICEALQFAHDEGIVHRDIKPENILIDKRGRVKIADFGLAKLLGQAADDLSLTGTGQLMGTLGYMAPEQLQQAHRVDHRADIYSLGVVFYEMLTGQLPIGRFDPPSKKVQVDVRLDEIVLRSLESEPDRRYQHAGDVKTDLDAMSTVMTQPTAYSPDQPQWQHLGRRVGESIAEHPILWMLALFLTLPIFILTGPLYGLKLSPYEADNTSPHVIYNNAMVAIFVLGPLAFLAWAHLWRSAHRRGAKDRQQREPNRRNLTQRISEHPIFWTVAILASLPAIFATAVLICSLIVVRHSAVSGQTAINPWLVASVLGLYVFGPLALAAWACLWWATRFLTKKPQPPRDQPAANITATPAVQEVARNVAPSRVQAGRTVQPFEPLSEHEARRQDALARRPPAWLDLAAICLFTAGWIFMGAMWNLRIPGLVLSTALLAGLVYLLVLWKLKYLPQLKAELSRQSRWRRGVALAHSGLVFVLAMICAAGFQRLAWDLFTPARDWLTKLPFAASGAEARSKFPIDRLKGVADVEILGGGGTFVPSGAFPTVVLGCGCAVIAVTLVVSAVQILVGTRLYRNSWRYSWGPALSVAMLLYCGFILPHVIHPLAVTSSNLPVRQISSPLTESQLTQTVDGWADANGYAPSSQRTWTIRRKNKGESNPIGTIRMIELRPAGLFGAWHLSASGLAWRALPPLDVTCVSQDNPANAFVSADAGLYTHGSPEETTWPAVLDSLAEAFQTGSPSTSQPARDELHPNTLGPLALAYGGSAICVLIGLGVARRLRSLSI